MKWIRCVLFLYALSGKYEEGSGRLEEWGIAGWRFAELGCNSYPSLARASGFCVCADQTLVCERAMAVPRAGCIRPC